LHCRDADKKKLPRETREQLIQAQIILVLLGTGLFGFSKDWISGFSDFGIGLVFQDLNTNCIKLKHQWHICKLIVKKDTPFSKTPN
jgi:hypothetical protein